MKLRRLGQAAIVLSGGYLAALAATRRWHQHWGRHRPGDHHALAR